MRVGGGSESRWRGQAGLCAGQAQGPSEAGVRAEKCVLRAVTRRRRLVHCSVVASAGRHPMELGQHTQHPAWVLPCRVPR